eukprot:scaffold705_cov402-Prasinococcus_capsulatus_cf.AAC.14
MKSRSSRQEVSRALSVHTLGTYTEWTAGASARKSGQSVEVSRGEGCMGWAYSPERTPSPCRTCG